MSHRISISHLTGSPFARNAALALWEKGILGEVITAFGFKNDDAIERVVSRLPSSFRSRLRRELGRRNWQLPEAARFSTHAAREFMRATLSASRLDRRIRVPQDRIINRNSVALDEAVARSHLEGIDGCYCYEDTAATTFQEAKRRGIRCLYDLPIMHHRMSRAILGEEAERFPELTDCLQAVSEPEWKLERKDREIELADHIFVASSVTWRSLRAAGVDEEKITVVPYGSPADYFHPAARQGDTFRALFVGLVGPRKGVHYLLSAWDGLKLPDSELTLLGALQFPQSWFSRHASRARYIRPVPHSALQGYYNMASVFVFPSLVEGFAMVLLEAMACGVPIITTPNTAGPDIITDGVEGFIVQIRDVDALREKIQWAHDNPVELRAMGEAARRRAEELTWARYRARLGEAIVALEKCHG